MSIDRNYVAEAIRLARQRWVGGPDYEFDLALADAVLAIVQPVEGVTLTPEEVHLLLSIFRDRATRYPIGRVEGALVARLEASS